MKTEKTDNELISEFMGWERYSRNSFKCPNLYPFNSSLSMGWTTFEENQLQFNTSWDWLMPVVDRILKTWTPTKGTWPYEYNQLANLTLGRSLADVYDVTVIFIKWYNANSQPLSTH